MYLYTTNYEFYIFLTICIFALTIAAIAQWMAIHRGKYKLWSCMMIFSVLALPYSLKEGMELYTSKRQIQYIESFTCLKNKDVVDVRNVIRTGVNIKKYRTSEFLLLNDYSEWKTYAEEKDCFPKK